MRLKHGSSRSLQRLGDSSRITTLVADPHVIKALGATDSSVSERLASRGINTSQNSKGQGRMFRRHAKGIVAVTVVL